MRTENLKCFLLDMAIKTSKVYRRQVIIFILIVFIVTLLCGCNTEKHMNENSSHEGDNQSKIELVNEDSEINPEGESIKVDEVGTQTNDVVILGKWYLERIALKSENFDDVSPEAYDNFDYDTYVGEILEYGQDIIKIGESSYLNPSYVLEMTNTSDYSDGGIFKSPTLAGLILSEEIYVSDSENYEWLSEVPIMQYKITLNAEVFNPLISSVLVLNEDTILVGTGGKIILATRIH